MRVVLLFLSLSVSSLFSSETSLVDYFEDLERISIDSSYEYHADEQGAPDFQVVPEPSWWTTHKKKILYYSTSAALCSVGFAGSACAVSSLHTSSDPQEKPPHAILFLGSTVATLSGIALLSQLISQEECFKALFKKKVVRYTRCRDDDTVVV